MKAKCDIKQVWPGSWKFGYLGNHHAMNGSRPVEANAVSPSLVLDGSFLLLVVIVIPLFVAVYGP